MTELIINTVALIRTWPTNKQHKFFIATRFAEAFKTVDPEFIVKDFIEACTDYRILPNGAVVETKG